jgi:RNA recognition motif-containing protein
LPDLSFPVSLHSQKINMDLFVAGLPYDMEKEELQEMFEEFGTVTSARVIIDRETGKSRGFGFVSMSDSDQAEKAIKDIHGSSIDGRTLTVKVAEERKGIGNQERGFRQQ